MTQHHDIVDGGWPATLFGWLVAGWGWFTAGMNGATLMVTMLSATLLVLKIIDAWRRVKASGASTFAGKLRAVTRLGSLE